MAVAKWFLKLTAFTPPLDAARIVLESRGRVVLHYLQSLAKRRNEHPEQIHQLRVATRRFGAALAIFKDLIRPGDYHTLRRLTRTARRSAGAARDVDVHRELMAARLRNAGSSIATLSRIFNAALTEQREDAYDRLIEVTHASTAPFSEAVRRALAHLRAVPTSAEGNDKNLGVMARKTLRRRLKALRKAAGKNLRNWDKLHRLRIAAKRLRYGMEVFAGCFPINFRRQLYRVVERIQEDIGRVNDLRNLAHTVKNLLDGLRRVGFESSSDLGSIEAFQKRVLAEARTCQTRFIRRWNRKGQLSFHRRVKNALNRPIARSRVRGPQLSKL